MKQTIILTADGSPTIYLPEMDEQYHSVFGAVTESKHVFIENGYRFHPADNPVIFEVGFGTGLNTLLTAMEAEKKGRETTYIAIEKYPVEKTILNKINYGSLLSKQAEKLFIQLHEVEWNKTIPVTKYFNLFKINSDILNFNFPTQPNYDVIFFDAFGPDKQPSMWTEEIFRKIFLNSSPGAIFVTYSAKGDVRRRLTSAGFKMERLPGPPGKKQMLRGIKPNVLN